MEKQRKTFLSYSRVNKDFALQLAKELKAEGFDIWLDQLDIPTGSRWDREIEKALKAAEIFMIILTPASVDSENVLDEIGFAIDTGQRILPVLLENCDVPFRLRRFQYVDFTDKGFNDGVKSAKELLRGLVDQPTTPRSEVHVAARTEMARDATTTALKAEPIESQMGKISSTGRNEKKPLSYVLVVVTIALVFAGWLGFNSLPKSTDKNSPSATQISQETPTSPVEEKTLGKMDQGKNVAISITSISPPLGTTLRSGQPVDFIFDIHYNLISLDSALLFISIGQVEGVSSEKCNSGASLVDANSVLIKRGEGDVKLVVTWGGDDGKGNIIPAGYLYPVPSLWKSDGSDAIEFLDYLTVYCYEFTP